MKMRFNIIALICAMYLLLGITTQAQTSNVEDDSVLELYSDGSFAKDISSIISVADYKKYFTDIIHITRVNSNTILLQSRNFTYPTIRIEISNGNPKVCKHSGKNILDYLTIQEGTILRQPVQVQYCVVRNINQDNNDITISIYQHKQNKLLGQKTYTLNSITHYHYKARLVNNQVLAYDGFGKEFKVTSFVLKTFDSIHGYTTYTGNTLSPQDANKIATKVKGKTYYISNIKIIGHDDKVCSAEPIEIR